MSRKTLSLALALAVATGGALAQGDDCTTATPITAGTWAFNTAGFTIPGPLASCTTSTADDGFFQYFAGVNGLATLTLCPTSTCVGANAGGADTFLAVWDASVCPPTTEIICADGAPNCGVNESELTFPITAGAIYYVQLGSWSGGAGIAGNLVICENSGAGAAPNDTPASPTFMAGPAATVADDNTTSFIDGPLGSCGIATGDLWYYVVASQNGIATATTCPTAGGLTGNLGTNADTVIAVFADNGGFAPGVELACSDDSCPAPGLASTASWSVTSGTGYFISVAGWNGTVGTFTLDYSEFGGPLALGDDCSVADPAPFAGPGVYPYNSAGFVVAGPIAGCNGIADTQDYWFQYLAQSTGIAIVSNCAASVAAPGGSATTGIDTTISAWDGLSCPPTTELACSDGSPDCGVAESEIVFPITAGTTYYIQVTNWAVGGPIAGAIAIVEAVAPVNDDCSGAIPLSFGVNGPFANNTATPSSPQGSCGLGADSDLWFSFVATCTGNLEIDTCGTGFDTWLSVWDNCPNAAGVELVCNDEAAAGPCFGGFGPSYVSIPVITGNTYYINVGGWGNQLGSFNVNARCTYIHQWSVPSGPGSIQLENIDGPPNSLAFSAVTLDILHAGLPGAVSFPNGWFYGVPMGFFELVQQITWPGGVPFGGFLDATGYMLNLSAPAGTTTGLAGATIWSVGVAFDPLTGFATVSDTTDPTAFTL